MVIQQTQQPATNNAYWGLPATFSETLLKGVEIPPEFLKYYWGFDFEIQLSDLDDYDLDYLNTAFEQINILAITIVEIEKYNKYQDKDISFYKNWSDEVNSEVKVIIRGRRGYKALTVRESKTYRTYGEEIIEEKQRERSGWFGRFIGGKGSKPR